MVQRIDLTGSVFRMLKENDLMIEESQPSIANQNRRHEEWMLRKNLDVPIEWSNDIVDISDQPYSPGYPILGPIQEIRDEGDPEAVFRFPTESELDKQYIDQLIEKQGTDALAWYRPFHMDPQEKWGITILDRGIWHVARFLALELYGYDGIYPDEDIIKRCRDIAKDFLYYHEMFHFKVELAATVMEKVSPDRALYSGYWKPQIDREWFGSKVKSNRQVKAPLEEALANSYALHKVCSEIIDVKQRSEVRRALKQFMKRQPEGYRHAEKFPYNGNRWKQGMNELLDKLLNQEDSLEWDPRRILASHVLFDGSDGKDDWIEGYYEGLVPCRILDTGIAQGLFAKAINKIDFGIFCVTTQFKRDMKSYPNNVLGYLEKSCQGFEKYTDGKGMVNYSGYEEFQAEADYWSKAERFIWEGGRVSKAGSKVYYYRLMGRNGYRVYHERFEGEDVLLRTHRKTTDETPPEIKAYLRKTPRPSTMAKHDSSCLIQ
jgi:hypothetical protein